MWHINSVHTCKRSLFRMYWFCVVMKTNTLQIHSWTWTFIHSEPGLRFEWGTMHGSQSEQISNIYRKAKATKTVYLIDTFSNLLNPTRVVLEPIPALIYRNAEKSSKPVVHNHTWQFSFSSLPEKQAFGLQDETGLSSINPHKLGN